MNLNYNPFTLVGKTILVTGASSGIGRSIAIECSRMGASVIITGRNDERLKETFEALAGVNNKMIVADLVKEDDIERIANESPLLDGVVHSAGIGDRSLLSSVSPKRIEKVMVINFKAPVLLQKSLLKKKKIADSSSIVFIASRAPHAPTVGNGLYAASKGALLAYAKVLGLELADRLIRVNSILPAMVWTELVKRDEEIMGVDYSLKEKEYPLKRFGKPEEIAYLTVYMLSDAAAWMTGSAVDITGGVNSL